MGATQRPSGLVATLANREQAEIQREAAASDRESGQASVAGVPPASPASQRLATLRRRLSAAAARLAEEEEKMARGHEERAARQPARADEYQQIAKDSRAVAERAREIALQFGE